MTKKSNYDLVKHLKEEHKLSPFGEHLKEIVYGGSDGIITTFAVVSGFAGAQASDIATIPTAVVLLFGFANLLADGTSMGLGNFLSLRAENDLYITEKQKEAHEIKNNPHIELAETVELYEMRGFSSKDASTLAGIISTNKPYWTEFMMKEELEMMNPDSSNLYLKGIATFFSFIIFGFVPLIPFVLIQHIPEDKLFNISIVCTASALLLLGFLRWRVTRQPFLRSIGETVLLGGISAGIAFWVGTLFKI